ncbi:MAG: DUF5009 domain-containing protein [Thermoguttaceae bacterium]|nr:DUF5009 domain-containing protein [Thermoguttaceae bacterium]
MGKKHRRKSYDYEFEEEFDDNAVDLNEYDRNDYKGSAEDDGKENEKEPLEPLSPEEKRKMAAERLRSLDALRGLNMLCIIGLATLITAICHLHSQDFQVFGDAAVRAAHAFRQSWIGPEPATIAKHMEHTEWNGVLHHDTIFPLFLFLAGVSWPFSLFKQQANERPTWRILLKILWRGIALVILGIIYSNKVRFDFENLRYMGVLQHIGLAWMFAALIYWPLARHTKTLVGICALILVSYWFVVALVPAPDVAPKEAFSASAYSARFKEMFQPRPCPIFEDNALPDFDAEDYPEIGTVAHNFLPEGCVVNYVDRKLVPGKLYHEPKKVGDEDFRRANVQEYDPALFRQLRDPEGLASTWPAIATALLGMIFGGFIRRDDREWSRWKKLSALLIGGVILLVIGWGWHYLFPINKNLWNSSFVCFVGGYSALALATFYFLFDILPLRWLAFPFAVVGMNSITIFVAKRVVDFSNMRDFFFKDAIDRFVPTTYDMIVNGETVTVECTSFAKIATYIAGLIVSWCFLYWLYRRKIFMRV